MKAINITLALLFSLMTLACTPDNSSKTKLFEDQRNALDKAKGVENTVQQQLLDTQKNAEKQTQ